jgi:hypothetical protein
LLEPSPLTGNGQHPLGSNRDPTYRGDFRHKQGTLVVEVGLLCICLTCCGVCRRARIGRHGDVEVAIECVVRSLMSHPFRGGKSASRHHTDLAGLGNDLSRLKPSHHRALRLRHIRGSTLMLLQYDALDDAENEFMPLSAFQRPLVQLLCDLQPIDSQWQIGKSYARGAKF